MLNKYADLSPDLVWMLQSNQPDDEVLIETLTRTYYLLIYQQALTLLDYPEEAHRAAQETIIQATLQAKKNQVSPNIGEWLFSILHNICGIRKSYLDSFHFLNPKLNKSIARFESHRFLSDQEIETAIRDIKTEILSRKINSRYKIAWKEFGICVIAVIGALIAFQLIDLTFLRDRLLTDNQQSYPEYDLSSDIRFGPPAQSADIYNNLQPKSTDFSFLPPLTRDASHEDIWRRMLLSHFLWKTIWVDLNITLWGPADYSGPPRTERHQLWLSQQESGLHLVGQVDGKVDRIESITFDGVGPQPTTFLHGREDYARLGSQIPWFYLSAEIIYSNPYMTNFFLIGDYDFPPQRIRYQVIDEQFWADRPVILVEATDNHGIRRAYLWLDSLTGITLREQFFSADSADEIRLETSVSHIKFDYQFPENIYHSIPVVGSEIHFANNELGTPELTDDMPILIPTQTLPGRLAEVQKMLPFDYNLDDKPIIFVPENGQSCQEGELIPVQIISNEYYLGDIELMDPLRTSCTRSPDGSYIAVSQWPDLPSQVSNTLTWYQLSDLRPLKLVIPNIIIAQLAFSPDNRFLAAAGINLITGKSDLYLIDTRTCDSQFISEIDDVWGLAWSPDGTQLAIMNWPSFRYQSQSNLRIVIYDLVQKVFFSEIITPDFPLGMSSMKIPLEGWNANFILSMSGLESCAGNPDS